MGPHLFITARLFLNRLILASSRLLLTVAQCFIRFNYFIYFCNSVKNDRIEPKGIACTTLNIQNSIEHMIQLQKQNTSTKRTLSIEQMIKGMTKTGYRLFT